jgi:hypothetical protein
MHVKAPNIFNLQFALSFNNNITTLARTSLEKLRLEELTLINATLYHNNYVILIILFLIIVCAGQSPSAYVIYVPWQFYTFPDHDTFIVPHFTDPHFSNDKLFPVSMDTHLDNYLKKQVYLIECL